MRPCSRVGVPASNTGNSATEALALFVRGHLHSRGTTGEVVLGSVAVRWWAFHFPSPREHPLPRSAHQMRGRQSPPLAQPCERSASPRPAFRVRPCRRYPDLSIPVPFSCKVWSGGQANAWIGPWSSKTQPAPVCSFTRASTAHEQRHSAFDSKARQGPHTSQQMSVPSTQARAESAQTLVMRWPETRLAALRVSSLRHASNLMCLMRSSGPPQSLAPQSRESPWLTTRHG